MEHTLMDIFSSSSFLCLSGLLAASLFFAVIGFREVKEGHLDGLLSVALSFFFACGHVYYLCNIPAGSPFAHNVIGLTVWSWLAVLFAPALIFLFLAFGLVGFATRQTRAGMVKTFFGLTLLCFVYMLGAGWPADVKGILIAIYCFVWFNVEYETVR